MKEALMFTRQKETLTTMAFKQLVAPENTKKTTPTQCSLAQLQRMTLSNFLIIQGECEKKFIRKSLLWMIVRAQIGKYI